jgi:hypothetical protein
MDELKVVSTLMSTTTSLDLDENGEAVDQRKYYGHDWLPPVPHGDTIEHSVYRVSLCTLSGFPTLVTSDNSSVNLQVP